MLLQSSGAAGHWAATSDIDGAEAHKSCLQLKKEDPLSPLILKTSLETTPLTAFINMFSICCSCTCTVSLRRPEFPITSLKANGAKQNTVFHCFPAQPLICCTFHPDHDMTDDRRPLD